MFIIFQCHEQKKACTTVDERETHTSIIEHRRVIEPLSSTSETAKRMGVDVTKKLWSRMYDILMNW